MLFSSSNSNCCTSSRPRLPFLNSYQAVSKFSRDMTSLKLIFGESCLYPPPRDFDTPIPIVAKTFDFYRQLHLWIHLFPKVERYSLGERLQTTTLDLLEDLLKANQLPNNLKARALLTLSAKLDLLRLLVRLALETKCLDNNKYLTLQSKLQEIGKMLGGWIRSVS